MTEWISTTDRLPDDDSTVLIAMSDGEVWIGHHDGEDWFDSFSAIGVGAAGVSVTHWMEFPEPPDAQA